MAKNILSWPYICCVFPKYFSHCLRNTRASPASLSVPLPSSRNRRTATKKGLCWYSNLHIKMQSIWEISLGTWLVLLGDYPPMPHSLFHRPNGRTEMRRFPEKNKFPGWFHTPLWKSQTSLKCSWYQIISCHPCPRHLADRSSLPHMDRELFPISWGCGAVSPQSRKQDSAEQASWAAAASAMLGCWRA